MKKSIFLELLKDTMDRLIHLTKTKGEEYSHDDDQLANFKRLSAELGNLPEDNLWVYFTKHKDSIVSYIKDLRAGKKRDLAEPIEGRIDDAILYLLLLKALVADRRAEEERATMKEAMEGGVKLISDSLSKPNPIIGDMPKFVSIAEASHRIHNPLIDEAIRACGPPASPTIEEMQEHIAKWADGVFPHRTARGSLAKLVLEEIPEFITSKMSDPLEYADLVILILDIAHLRGINVGEAVVRKMAINEKRTWMIDTNTGFLKHTNEDSDV